jgi:hypothetical protein
MIKEAEDQVRIIREHLKTAQSRQKSYYDRHHQDVSYEIGEKAYLRVTPLKGVHRFGIKGKLAPHYVGPFPILAKRGELAYQLELPSTFLDVHDVFHVSQLKRCILFLSLIWLKEKLEAEPSSSSKFSGLIILNKKQLGNERIFFDPSTLPFSLVLRNLGMRFL